MPRPMKINDCPYCGSNNLHIYKTYINTTVAKMDGFAVHCNTCGLHGPVFKRLLYAISSFNALRGEVG